MQGALQLEITDDGGFIATGQHEGSGSHGDCDIYVYKLLRAHKISPGFRKACRI